MALTMNSTLAEVYANPIGHDALAKMLLQLGQSETLINNPLVGHLKLSQLSKVAGLAKIPPDFFSALLNLLNLAPKEEDTASINPAQVQPEWWKEAVIYQIYPRSFQDSDGDGIGDLRGIIDRLDYLQGLGVDAIWLSPIYDSPNDDNGYDIRNYQEIMAEFGTMYDFDTLLASLHKRGMKLIMDLVVNHTSDEQPWFQKALAGDKKYQDYYVFRDGADPAHPDTVPPNNWTSFFSGPAWNFYPELGKWGLHLFSKKQMDLNWDNPAVRQEVVDMINWWLDKGVDGFRLDVINYISKENGLPDGNQTIADLMGYRGVEKYYFGPHLHEYLHQLKTEAFEPHNAFTVGETPGVGIEMAKLLTAAPRRELDMIFSFDQLDTPGHTRFDDYQYDLNYLKKYLIEWTENYPNDCWMSLFYNNHDNPRMVSKVTENPEYREVIAKLLAIIQLTGKGTPFIFQGDEIGMANQKFGSMDELRDVESLNLYQEKLAAGDSPEDAFRHVLAGTRDHARVPMQWNDGRNAGFTTGTPWIQSDGDYLAWNVSTQQRDPNSILNFYRDLIELRHLNKDALVYGDIKYTYVKRGDYFGYFRTSAEVEPTPAVERSSAVEPVAVAPLPTPSSASVESTSSLSSRLSSVTETPRSRPRKVFFIECNLAGVEQIRPRQPESFELLFSNYPEPAETLRPYEANIYRVR